MPYSLALPLVLFDMDGVLVDVSKSYRRAIEETVYFFTGRKVKPVTIQRYKDRGGFNDDWVLTHEIVGDYGMEVAQNRIVNEFQRHYRGEDWDGFIMEEIPLVSTEILQKLRDQGHILGIVTGRPRAEAHWALDRFGWRKIFSLLVPREKQDDRTKPDPYPLLYALGILHGAGLAIEPHESVYIGDSVDDMTAARAAKMHAIGFIPPYLDHDSHGKLLCERGAQLIISNPDTLPSLVSDPNQWSLVGSSH
ncbi:MAG: TIGR01548 family HAD-type hydrolase [Bacteroidetes bacterium]|nr:TIGR01548 family HAD-type hydrolase [Bacteroidota bacterium]MCY4232648.1 TIGR01548 family HAD-type hydrolase [Bacteroidota bacterium]